METIKRQTRTAYGCLVVGKSLWAQALRMAYRLYCSSVCDTNAPLQLRYAACGAIYMLYCLCNSCPLCVTVEHQSYSHIVVARAAGTHRERQRHEGKASGAARVPTLPASPPFASRLPGRPAAASTMGRPPRDLAKLSHIRPPLLADAAAAAGKYNHLLASHLS